MLFFEGLGPQKWASANISSTFAHTEVPRYHAVNLISVYSPPRGMSLPVHPENGL